MWVHCRGRRGLDDKVTRILWVCQISHFLPGQGNRGVSPPQGNHQRYHTRFIGIGLIFQRPRCQQGRLVPITGKGHRFRLQFRFGSGEAAQERLVHIGNDIEATLRLDESNIIILGVDLNRLIASRISNRTKKSFLLQL